MPLQFLVVDDSYDGRFIISKTLLRRFPSAVITESEDGGAAVSAVASGKIAVALVHRSRDQSGLQLVTRLRQIAPTMPIVCLSGNESTEAAALAAGATKFLHADKGLLVGSIVAGLLPADQQPNPPNARAGETDSSAGRGSGESN